MPDPDAGKKEGGDHSSPKGGGLGKVVGIVLLVVLVVYSNVIGALSSQLGAFLSMLYRNSGATLSIVAAVLLFRFFAKK